MDAKERQLAQAADNLTARDFRYLEEKDMLPDSSEASECSDSQQTAVSEPKNSEKSASQKNSSEEACDQESESGSEERKRRKVEHEWPEVGTILEADYKGQHYEAEVISMPRYKNGKAVKILSGPANGEVERSMSGAMLTATEKQREENDLGRSGVANGWEFWDVKGEPGQE